ncbi:015R [Invertebrate iridescent virus 6]|uniref:015R n=1 Tax=Invertebrate iridescent virus 6 TaxID=176652 RepID=Q91G80_IIV6|nr:015R [Invertebrate iridescent virus 6]AAK81952.1 015R [Invertebrate iridescent virus 6]QMS79653.1 hypothetical protein IIV6-T1_017 [Invertebrate iridescent virus 6]
MLGICGKKSFPTIKHIKIKSFMNLFSSNLSVQLLFTSLIKFLTKLGMFINR